MGSEARLRTESLPRIEASLTIKATKDVPTVLLLCLEFASSCSAKGTLHAIIPCVAVQEVLWQRPASVGQIRKEFSILQFQLFYDYFGSFLIISHKISLSPKQDFENHQESFEFH